MDIGEGHPGKELEVIRRRNEARVSKGVSRRNVVKEGTKTCQQGLRAHGQEFGFHSESRRRSLEGLSRRVMSPGLFFSNNHSGCCCLWNTWRLCDLGHCLSSLSLHPFLCRLRWRLT